MSRSSCVTRYQRSGTNMQPYSAMFTPQDSHVRVPFMLAVTALLHTWVIHISLNGATGLLAAGVALTLNGEETSHPQLKGLCLVNPATSYEFTAFPAWGARICSLPQPLYNVAVGGEMVYCSLRA